MNELLALTLTGAAGAGLGAFYFGGLWWTVRMAVRSRVPALWFIGSLMLRTAAALAGFYACSGGSFRRLAACLAGFVAARLLAIRLIRTPRPAPAQEAIHAP